MEKEEIRKQLGDLNTIVEKAIAARTKFLDENMHHFAEFQIGEKVWDCANNCEATCTGHYRYHSEDPRYDTTFSVNCNISTRNFTDNTSRHGGTHPFVTVEDYKNKSTNCTWASGRFSRY